FTFSITLSPAKMNSFRISSTRPARAWLFFIFLFFSFSASALTVSIVVHNPCSGCTGQLNASASGGTAPYQYSWDGGNNWYSSGLYYGLCAGTYTVIARDALSATATASATIVIAPAITFSASPTNCS